MTETEYLESLARLRQEIDEVDARMALLFEKRLHLSSLAGKLKTEAGIDLNDPARESEILAKGLGQIKDSVVAGYYKDFADKLLSYSKSFQKETVKK